MQVEAVVEEGVVMAVLANENHVGEGSVLLALIVNRSIAMWVRDLSIVMVTRKVRVLITIRTWSVFVILVKDVFLTTNYTSLGDLKDQEDKPVQAVQNVLVNTVPVVVVQKEIFIKKILTNVTVVIKLGEGSFSVPVEGEVDVAIMIKKMEKI